MIENSEITETKTDTELNKDNNWLKFLSGNMSSSPKPEMAKKQSLAKWQVSSKQKRGIKYG